MKLLKHLLVIMCLCAAETMVFPSYSQNSGDQSEADAYWSSYYRQKQLNGKVKTVKSYDHGFSGFYDNYVYLEFDANGNLLKDGVVIPSQGDYFSGFVFSYDAQNRLIKATSEAYDEVIEFGYDGSHNMYMPTNFYDMINLDMSDLRLQKGVTSFHFTEEGDVALDIKCTSVSGNHLTYTGTAGGDVAELVGNIDRIEIDCQGNYPVELQFMNGNTVNMLEETTLGTDGMPVKFVLGGTLVSEFTTIAGFLLQTKIYDSSNPNGYRDERQYNDKGYPTDDKEYYNGEVTEEISWASYEYDAHGNWTKRVQTDIYSNNNIVTTQTREYTYWPTTGINPVSQATTLKAWVADGTLHVSGLTAGQTWSVYNIAGVQIYQNVATDTQNFVSLQNHGVYIVQSGNNTTKIVY